MVMVICYSNWNNFLINKIVLGVRNGRPWESVVAIFQENTLKITIVGQYQYL